jgi:S-adenosylmethionine decarboxylase
MNEAQTAVETSQEAIRRLEDPIKEAYSEHGSWGIWSGIDLHECDPDTIRDAEKIKEFVYELCKRIEVNRYGECQVVHFGEDPRVAGFSMIQLIETSLISGHFANQTNAVYLDIFSCKYYNPKVVAEYAKDFFEAKDYTLNYTFRK